LEEKLPGERSFTLKKHWRSERSSLQRGAAMLGQADAAIGATLAKVAQTVAQIATIGPNAAAKNRVSLENFRSCCIQRSSRAAFATEPERA
jgi:hypothetical protein